MFIIHKVDASTKTLISFVLSTFLTLNYFLQHSTILSVRTGEGNRYAGEVWIKLLNTYKHSTGIQRSHSWKSLQVLSETVKCNPAASRELVHNTSIWTIRTEPCSKYSQKICPCVQSAIIPRARCCFCFAFHTSPSLPSSLLSFFPTLSLDPLFFSLCSFHPVLFPSLLPPSLPLDHPSQSLACVWMAPHCEHWWYFPSTNPDSIVMHGNTGRGDVTNWVLQAGLSLECRRTTAGYTSTLG